MKSIYSLFLVPAALALIAPAAMAAPKLDRVYFCGLAEVQSKNGAEVAGTNQNDSTAIYQKRLLRGEVRIYEVDDQTLQSRMTRVPAMLRITHAGAELRARWTGNARDNCSYSFSIYNNVGKSVGSMFGTYEGGSIGITAIANLGMKFLYKSDGHYIFTPESAFGGIGINAGSYIKYELRAGSQQTNQVEVSNPQTGGKTTISQSDALKAVLH